MRARAAVVGEGAAAEQVAVPVHALLCLQHVVTPPPPQAQPLRERDRGGVQQIRPVLSRRAPIARLVT